MLAWASELARRIICQTMAFIIELPVVVCSGILQNKQIILTTFTVWGTKNG